MDTVRRAVDKPLIPEDVEANDGTVGDNNNRSTIAALRGEGGLTMVVMCVAGYTYEFCYGTEKVVVSFPATFLDYEPLTLKTKEMIVWSSRSGNSEQEESIQPNNILLCHNSLLNVQIVRLCNLSGMNLMTGLVT